MFNNLGMNCFRCSVIVALIFLTSPFFVAEADQDKQGEYYPDNTFWGALIYASNDLEKSTVSDKLEKKLNQAFGSYSNFQLLGQHTQKNVFKEYVNWVVPSEEINLAFESKGKIKGNGVKLLLKLWRKKKVLLKSDLTIFPEKPVMILGPKWREGKLIFVLDLRLKS